MQITLNYGYPVDLPWHHFTNPSMITGIRPSAEITVRKGFAHIKFVQIEESQAKAADYYLKSLQPIPSPFLKKGRLSSKAKKGKKVFLKKWIARIAIQVRYLQTRNYILRENKVYTTTRIDGILLH